MLTECILPYKETAEGWAKIDLISQRPIWLCVDMGLTEGCTRSAERDPGACVTYWTRAGNQKQARPKEQEMGNRKQELDQVTYTHKTRL